MAYLDNGINLFGLEIKRKDSKSIAEKNAESFVLPTDEEGTTTIIAGGCYGHYVDIHGDKFEDDNKMIIKYRQIAEHPEVEQAIEDIVNEAIVFDDDINAPVSLNTSNLDQPDNIKKALQEEFEKCITLLNFNFNGFDIFRRWYIDGRIYFHVVIDKKKPKNGILQLRPIDPLNIRKVREVEKEKDPKTGVDIIKEIKEYFVYTPYNGSSSQSGGEIEGIKISPDAIIYAPSGYSDYTRRRVLSPLHKAIKPVNQLRLMEEALVIYRLARAPERRIFYIDTGSLPKGKSEAYVQSIMNKYKNKLTYDAVTGEIKDEVKHMSMQEDYWLPRREGGRGTEIDTLSGGENLGQIEDVEFFKKKLARALNVPLSRLEPESQFTLGRANEINRDELKFQKFVNKLRKKFSVMFIDALKTQLILKGIINSTEWPAIREQISVDYQRDSYFSELKESEILAERIRILQDMEQYIGDFYSKSWIKRNVLRMSDEDIDNMKKEIEEEKKAGEYEDEDEDV